MQRLIQLLRITYLKTESPHLVGRATPDAAGKARPTVNHLTAMNYVILNNGRNHGPITPFSRRWEKGWGERSEGGGAGSVRCKKRDFCSTSLSLALSRLRERGFVLQFHPTSIGVAGNIT